MRKLIQINIAATLLLAGLFFGINKLFAMDLNFECPATGRHFFPYGQDCKQFIYCDNGIGNIVDCPPGYLFDNNLGFCVKEGLVNCGYNHCPDPYDVPDHYIQATLHDSSVTSDSKGNINIGGYVAAGYDKNKTYSVTYQIKNCDGKQEKACCKQSEVGVTLISVR